VARRARESVHFSGQDLLLAHLVPLGCGPCVRRTGHPFAASGPRGPSQKIELVFSASPETVSGSLRKILISVAHSVSALGVIPCSKLISFTFRQLTASFLLPFCSDNNHVERYDYDLRLVRIVRGCCSGNGLDEDATSHSVGGVQEMTGSACFQRITAERRKRGTRSATP